MGEVYLVGASQETQRYGPSSGHSQRQHYGKNEPQRTSPVSIRHAFLLLHQILRSDYFS